MDRFTRTLRKLNERKSADVMTLDEAADTMPVEPNDAALFVFAVFANAANAMTNGPTVTCGDVDNWSVFPFRKDMDGYVPILPVCEQYDYDSESDRPCHDLASHIVTWRFWYDDDPDVTPFYDDTIVHVCPGHLAESTEPIEGWSDEIMVAPIYGALL